MLIKCAQPYHGDEIGALFFYNGPLCVNVRPPSELSHSKALYLPHPSQKPLITPKGLWGGDKNASVESSCGLDVGWL